MHQEDGVLTEEKAAERNPKGTAAYTHSSLSTPYLPKLLCRPDPEDAHCYTAGTRTPALSIRTDERKLKGAGCTTTSRKKRIRKLEKNVETGKRTLKSLNLWG